ncbi:NlpC/P60 family protein [Streptomyces sp. NPDC047525]|uniref:C40 family peptidase n=1 Tax=Streptomyces sp. NPDC047525 TaxID=3155264 RepID=UPI0033FDE581
MKAAAQGAAAVAALCFGMVFGLTIWAGSEDGDAANGDDAGFAGELDTSKIPKEYRKWVIKAGSQCAGVTAPLIAAQIEAESGWNPDAKSPAKARGLSQFIPGTWESHKVDADGGGASWRSGPDNIMTQAAYDCVLMKEVKSYKLKGDPVELMLAAYNAGPWPVKKYGGIPPYRETQEYVKRITGLIPKYTQELSPASGPMGQRIAAEAKKQLGEPYAWGGGGIHGPSRGIQHGASTVGFDCSGLTQWAVYRGSKGKITLPRSSQMQIKEGKGVRSRDVRAGDLVGWALNGAGNYDHIGIAIGGGQFIHAPKTGDVVKISSLDEPYYANRPMQIRRLGS